MALHDTVAGVGRRPRDEHIDFADMRRRLRAIFVGSVGNLVEWYDFYAYAAFALYFAKSFFPEGDEVAQQLNAAVLFAAGFLVRPLGGWLFGHLADHYGRRNALTLSVPDRRPAVRDPGPAAAAKGVLDGRRIARLGLAHSVRDRRRAGDRGGDHAAQSARDRRLRRRQSR